MVFDLEGRVLMEETLVGNVKYALPLIPFFFFFIIII
jgi:hypothetical protein